MYYGYTIMGQTKLPLNIDEETFSKSLEKLVNNFGDSFSYRQLYTSFKYEAVQNDWFKKEPYTQYANIELTDKDAHKISKYLWKMIWEKKLILEFNYNEYRSNYPSDYMFSKVEL